MATFAVTLPPPVSATWEALSPRGRAALRRVSHLSGVPVDSGRYPAPMLLPIAVEWVWECLTVQADPEAPQRLGHDGDLEAWLAAPLPQTHSVSMPARETTHASL